VNILKYELALLFTSDT